MDKGASAKADRAGGPTDLSRSASQPEALIPSVEVPADIVGLVLHIGLAEWGQTHTHDAAGHAEHVADSVRMTAEHFGQEGPQHMHGLYREGTGTVICHTGTSPNSPEIARALTGAWNWLYEQCASQGIEAGTAETERLGAKPESPVGEADAPNTIGEWRA